MRSGSEMCVSWDFMLRDWIPNGCTTIVGQDGVVTCSCNHLTNFAVLVVGYNEYSYACMRGKVTALCTLNVLLLSDF